MTMNTVHIWRGKMTDKTKFKIYADDDCVGICYHEDDCNHMNDCITIWIDDGDTKSPFKSEDEAIAIARIFAKILNMVV